MERILKSINNIKTTKQMKTKEIKPKYTVEFKKKLSNAEIEGLEKMFNDFMLMYENREYDEELSKINYGFFWCSDYLCSEDSANGTPIQFEGLNVSYLGLTENGNTYIICDKKKEGGKEIVFEFNKYNGEFYKLS